MGRKHKSVYGVGINDATYRVYLHEWIDGKQTIVWRCPYYARWCHMLKRCYSKEYHEHYPTYSGCSVCEDWLVFSNFRSWMEKQDWEGKHLDKDLLVSGNKEYGPNTCVFVTPLVNSFTLDKGASRGECPIGVYFNKEANKFMATCRNPFTRKRENLGYSHCPEQAHLAWKRRKHELACQLANSEYVTDELVAQALRTRYL